MRSEKRTRNSVQIPIDVIITIFSKLDVKSIARCRCVSKLWSSILRRLDFIELFLSRSCSRTPKLLLAYQKDSELYFFSSTQPQNLDENSSLVVLNYHMKFAFHGLAVIHLVHGLICLADLRNLKICNPSTGETLVLPKSRYFMWSLLGYDPIGKQFKVLSMLSEPGMCRAYQVLTLGTENVSWKKIECCIPHRRLWKKIFINGVLYYTSSDLLTNTCLIACFDVRFEKFSFIKPVKTIKRGVIDKTVELINYNGKLGLLLCQDGKRPIRFDGGSIRVKFWVLEDLEKQEWSNHTFLFPVPPEYISARVRFVGVTQTNEIVLLSIFPRRPLYLFYLNLEKKTFVRRTIEGIEETETVRYQIFLDHVEDVKLYGHV